MTEGVLIEQLAAAVATHLAALAGPSIPLAAQAWDIATIAQVLKRDPQVVRERMACMPDFPKAIRLPTKQGRAQPLYWAKEILAWMQSYQEKH